MPRTTAPSTNPRIVSGYAPYSKPFPSTFRQKGSTSTTEERRQLLINDPHARDVHPEQVTCTRCGKTVRLQKGKAYHLAHWLDHRWRCDKAVAATPQPRAKSRTLAERKSLLEMDPDTRNVEAGHVTCAKCDKEIKFRKGRPYGLSSWVQHKTTCKPRIVDSSPMTPSAAVSPLLAFSKRHKELGSDPLVAMLESERVKCALCLSWIDLSLQVDMDVNVWRRHRASCVSENYPNDNHKVGWTRARFFRPRHRLAVSAGQDAGTDTRSSPVTDDIPRSRLNPDSPQNSVGNGLENEPSTSQPSLITKKNGAAHPTSLVSAPSSSSSGFPKSRFASPPPLSFSEATSAETSAACTPDASPRRAYNLPGIRHLPFPEYTPLSLSRFVSDIPAPERELSALGLRLLTPQSSEKTALHPVGVSPPPYPERTQLSLPIPTHYWRFDSTQ